MEPEPRGPDKLACRDKPGKDSSVESCAARCSPAQVLSLDSSESADFRGLF